METIFLIVLATALCMMGTAGAFMFVAKKLPNLDDMPLTERRRESERATRIAHHWGATPIRIVRTGFGFLGVFPAIALAGWTVQRFQPTPDIETVVSYLASWVVGWAIFGWLLRITNALEDDEIDTLETS